MNYDPTVDDKILENVLFRADRGDSAIDDDESDELLALFFEGRLEGDDREKFFHCLDSNRRARCSVGAYLQRPASVESFTEAAPSSSLVVASPGLRRRTILFLPRPALALAAMLLLAVGTVTILNWPGRTLPAVAMRDPNLLDYAHFGERDGQPREGSPSALNVQLLWETLPAGDDRQRLQEGFELLGKGFLPEARDRFSGVNKSSKAAYFAHLGSGIAWFREHRFSDAKIAFDSALQIKPESTAAKIGLAKTLARLGRNTEAVPLFEDAARDQNLPKEQIEQIRIEIAILTSKPAN